MKEDKATCMLTFAAGFIVGLNWPKIQKKLAPLLAGIEGKSSDAYSGVMRFFAEQKEAFGDVMAERRVVKKVKKQAAKQLIEKAQEVKPALAEATVKASKSK